MSFATYVGVRLPVWKVSVLWFRRGTEQRRNHHNVMYRHALICLHRRRCSNVHHQCRSNSNVSRHCIKGVRHVVEVLMTFLITIISFLCRQSYCLVMIMNRIFLCAGTVTLFLLNAYYANVMSCVWPGSDLSYIDWRSLLLMEFTLKAYNNNSTIMIMGKIVILYCFYYLYSITTIIIPEEN